MISNYPEPTPSLLPSTWGRNKFSSLKSISLTLITSLSRLSPEWDASWQPGAVVLQLALTIDSNRDLHVSTQCNPGLRTCMTYSFWSTIFLQFGRVSTRLNAKNLPAAYGGTWTMLFRHLDRAVLAVDPSDTSHSLNTDRLHERTNISHKTVCSQVPWTGTRCQKLFSSIPWRTVSDLYIQGKDRKLQKHCLQEREQPAAEFPRRRYMNPLVDDLGRPTKVWLMCSKATLTLRASKHSLTQWRFSKEPQLKLIPKKIFSLISTFWCENYYGEIDPWICTQTSMRLRQTRLKNAFFFTALDKEYKDCLTTSSGLSNQTRPTCKRWMQVDEPWKKDLEKESLM